MFSTISRRVFLSFLASGAATAALSAPPAASLRPVLRGAEHAKKAVPGAEAIVAAAKLGGQVCYAVADARTGARLEGGNAKTGTPPASVAKAVTALYALNILGPGHRFTTRLVATGSVSGGVVTGDLILVGGGDPTLDTNGLAALAAALKAKGIREVRGSFKVAEGALPYVKTIDTEQPDHVGYSPAVSGVALNYNRVHFEWKRSGGAYGVTMDARSDRYRPDVYVAKMQIVDRRVPVYTYADGGRSDNWTVAKSALGNGGARWLPVRKPALYAGDVFQTLARSHGIVLKNPKVVDRAPGGTVLASHQSDDLRTILRDMLRFSTNVTAEMVGMSATAKRTGKVPANLRASAAEMNRWAKATLGTTGMRLVDHSGLGGKSKMTADDMVQALVRAHDSAVLRPILKPVAMRDEKRRILKNHPITVDAKTGTLNFVSGLAGYMTARDGRVMAFAIFAADEATRSRISKANREAPQGARSWNGRAKVMQQRLIDRWGTVYGS
ncbi:D-alanyl-D-alanine carboxypeptidase/D-alanyl-D-alanine-endopeptidase [uncultured Tateyamaria sp.]|uniref:D-alanyl-D-alanine carboxypeptidase/D-alanyl-D-alanine endopeptidase n=1 Tax=uncultured Tateyamaria sp. TaxID=455651 RepID=UPI00261A83CF|nr:D-alanyl-D-alanine carboxypeptidase/D-alanyl-D-alanine-endopeptidase [uncultured Tateyamaria sp.]